MANIRVGFGVDVIQSIQNEWDFMASDDCLPAQVALQLMDTSTLGKADREADFLDVHEQIQKTLKAVVNGRSHTCRYLGAGTNVA